MPLLKLRLKEEQALASPDLYRQAPKDDPRALLDAANFADLVGVVRQLGELSDYAAVMFYELHAESSKLGARGDALLTRVRALGEKMPEAEARVYTMQDTRQLLPNPGLEWRASCHTDQNLFTQSELPPYVSKAYLDAQPPPPLHVLDRFDRAPSDGVTLRRYSDPSFFTREWALAELAQAEREKKAKKAKRKAKHQAERRNSRDLNDAVFVKQPSRSRRNSRSLSLRASPAVPAPRPPPLVLPEDAQRYSVYVPKEPKTLNPEDPQRYSLYIPEAPETLNPEESNLPTPATQGTISPYVESGVGSPHEDLGIGKGQDTVSPLGDESNRVPLLENPPTRSAPDAASLCAEPGSAERKPAPSGQENGQVAEVERGVSREKQDPPSGDGKIDEEKNAGLGDPAAESPTVPSASPNVQKDSEGATSGQRTEAQKASVSDRGEASGRESIPRARRRSATGGPKASAGEDPQKGDGETEPAFPRAESFDSITQAARVREQLRRNSELRNEKLAQSSKAGADDADDFLSADERSLVGRTASQMSVLDAVWIEIAREEGREHSESERAGEGAPAQEKPADVTADVSIGSDECEVAGAEAPNGRLSRAGSPAASPLPGGSGPGSPVNPGLLKLQQDYQQAQARLEQLLRMQQELEEQAAPPPLELRGAGAGFGMAPSSTSLVVELSRSSRGEDPEGPKPAASPSEAVDIDSPTWSRSSSPILHPPPARFAESPAPPRKVHSILDSPGPSFSLRGRGLPRIGSSSRFSSPPRQPSPGLSSPYSSPERSSPLRRPWSLGGALAKAEKGLPPPEAEEYQASGLSAETSRWEEHYTNGGLEKARVPTPPPKPLPKPPPLPPPGSLAGFNKPPQAAPPPPPPPLRPGALSISAPSSSRGGVPRPGDLMQAIAQHDKGKLKRVEERGDPSTAVPAADSRNVMLEQIKQGVNLRRTELVKHEEKPVRPVTDINVASILERANAIRQAMQDSDDDEDDDEEDDEWSD